MEIFKYSIYVHLNFKMLLVQLDKIMIKVIKKIYWDLRCSNVRGLYYKFKFKKCGNRLKVGKNCRINNAKNICVGNNVVIDNNVELLVGGVNERVQGVLSLGDYVHLSKFNCIGCCGKIVLENHVRLAPYVHITDRNHSFDNIQMPIWQQPIIIKDVYIGSETWIGFGAQIMPGVHIGRHCVVAAGSVVTKNIPDYSVVAGVPAKIVKQYNQNTKRWEKVNTMIS